MLPNRVIEFLSQSDEECLSQLHFGVEWEVSDAGNLNSSPEVDVDSDEVYDWLLGGEDESTYAAQLIGLDTDRRRGNPLQISDRDDLENFIDSYTRYSFSSLLDDALTSYCENNDNNDGLPEDVTGWNVKPEGTRGIIGEYVTQGCCNLEEQLERCERLLDEAGRGFECPTNGSFHIHLNIPGQKHQLASDSKLHCCILFELSQLVEEFPACFDRRLRSAESYFSLCADATTKFSAVHSHGQGTLEFRLFGHVEDLEDAEVCLRIAGLAFVRGYRRYAGGEYSIADAKLFRGWFADAIKRGEPMTLEQIAAPKNELERIAGGYVFQTQEEEEHSETRNFQSMRSRALIDWLHVETHNRPWSSDLYDNTENGYCFQRDSVRRAIDVLVARNTQATQESVLAVMFG